jgi:hypothetical protein
MADAPIKTPVLNQVFGYCEDSPAVSGESITSSGISGTATGGQGVTGSSTSGIGVIGYSESGPALLGQGNSKGPGLLAFGSYGVNAETAWTLPISNTDGALPAAVTELITANPGFAALLSGKVLISDSLTGKDATFSNNVDVKQTLSAKTIDVQDGVSAANVTVTGTFSANDVVLTGADCAEEFSVVDGVQLEPGTVVIFNGADSIVESHTPYDKRVAGVISGAGKFRPGIILGSAPPSEKERAVVAMMGRVYCKVDASHSPIEIGDLLTTSSTHGCAMKASDPLKAFGSVIGKALSPLEGGKALIPILVMLT